MANSGRLSTKKQLAIAALLSSRNVTEAAGLAGIGARTLFRWLQEPDFQQALTQAEGEAIDAATRRLIGLQSSAIDTLTETLENQRALPGVRLRASTSILDYLLKLRELRNVESRLAALEATINEHRN